MPSKGIGVVLLLLLGYVMVALAVRCHKNLHSVINYDDPAHYRNCEICSIQTEMQGSVNVHYHGCVTPFELQKQGYTLDEIEDYKLADGTVNLIGAKIRHCATDYCNLKLDPPPSLTCYHNFDRYTGILYPARGKKNAKQVSGCHACLYMHNWINDWIFGEFLPDIYMCLDQKYTDNKIDENTHYPHYGMALHQPNTCNEGSFEGVTIKFMYCDTGNLCTDVCGSANHVGMGWGAVLAVAAFFVAYLNL